MCYPLRLSLAVMLLLLAFPSTGISQWPQEKPNLKALYAVVGRMHNIDAELLQAIAEVESGGDPLSISPKGALGLMQLMPSTASEFSVPDPFDPVSNVLGAADFIDYLRNRFANTMSLQGLPALLAAYNAGPGAVEKYGGVPPYTETHQYVNRVIQRYARALTARPAVPPPVFIHGPSYFPRALRIVPSLNDGDSAALNQLAEIRRGRAQFAAGLARVAGRQYGQPVERGSAQFP